MVPPESVDVSVNETVSPLAVKVKFAVGVPPLPLTMGCEISQRLVSFDQVLCIANEPVEKVTNAEAPWPELIHAHSSPFSCPVNEEPGLLTHPPAGFWSVMVSAYSWPPTMEKPSSELLTKFARQLAPRSST